MSTEYFWARLLKNASCLAANTAAGQPLTTLSAVGSRAQGSDDVEVSRPGLCDLQLCLHTMLAWLPACTPRPAPLGTLTLQCVVQRQLSQELPWQDRLLAVSKHFLRLTGARARALGPPSTRDRGLNAPRL